MTSIPCLELDPEVGCTLYSGGSRSESDMSFVTKSREDNFDRIIFPITDKYTYECDGDAFGKRYTYGTVLELTLSLRF